VALSTMLVGSLPSPELGPSFPTLMVPTTSWVAVLSTVMIPEVSPPTHSCEPSGVRATVSGSPEIEIVLVTVSELAPSNQRQVGVMDMGWVADPVHRGPSDPHGASAAERCACRLAGPVNLTRTCSLMNSR